MHYEDSIHKQAERSGIQPDYYDIWGQHHIVPVQSKLALLNAMGQPTDQQAVADLLNNTSEQTACLPPVLIAPQASVTLPLVLPEGTAIEALQWRLESEDQSVQQGHLNRHQLAEAERFESVGKVYQRWQWRFEQALPCGYHRLVLNGQNCALIIVPERCYLPPILQNGGKRWGLSIQLYALRSQDNWGMGDFSDLQQVLKIAAELGAACVGLNPLHALFPHDASRYSPYSPSSRRFINPLYLDVETIPDYAQCQEAQNTVRADDFQAQLRVLQTAELIDYPAVAQLKFKILRQVFRYFYAQVWADQSSERAKALRAFIKAGGPALHKHVLAEALQDWFYSLDPACEGWTTWLPSYRDPASEPCARFAEQQAQQVLFYQYLQWQAHEQLQACSQLAQTLGLEIGLYGDLAVGVQSEGAEVWAEQSVYASGVHIGAPPDDFSPTGQDWGLVPYNPAALRDSAYRAFIEALRAVMRYTGAVRIDHVMGLARLFWIPPGAASPAAGAYVRYPFADLLGVLALESQRSQCMVIGEDLGTVEDHVRAALSAAGVLSYRVLYFEKHWQGDQSFKLPEQYPAQALVTASTHDLPTVLGFWQGQDLQLRTELGLFPSPDVEQSQQRAREQDKTRLLEALAKAGLNPQDGQAGLNQAIQTYLARSPAQLLLLQLEDALELVEQVNLPGTTDQYTNWRRRLPVPVENWLEDGRLRELADSLNAERGKQ